MVQDLAFRITVTDAGTAVVQRFTGAIKRVAGAAARSAAGVAASFRTMGASIKGVVQSVINLRTAFIGIIAIAAIRKLVTTLAEFESRMLRVGAITGAVGEEFEQLENVALRLGETTVFTAREAAGAMQFLAQAGFETNEIIGATPKVLELAAAGMIDLATSADIVTNVMAGLGLEIDELGRANDVLVKTFTSSNVNLQQLGLAFKFAGPIARTAGIEFEELSAAIGLLGNAGIQGTLAGTSLKNAIARLLNPVGEAGKIVKELNLQILDSNDRMRPFADILRDLGPIANDAGKILQLFAQRAGPGMAALLIQGADKLEELTDELKNSTGVAAEIAERQMSGLTGAIKLMQSAFEGLVLSTRGGVTPVLITIVDVLRDFFLNTKNAIRALSIMSERMGEIQGVGFLEFLQDAARIFGRSLIIGITIVRTGILGLKLVVQGIIIVMQIFVLQSIKAISSIITFWNDLTKTVSDVAKAILSVLTKLIGDMLENLGKAIRQISGFVGQIKLKPAQALAGVLNKVDDAIRDSSIGFQEFSKSLDTQIGKVRETTELEKKFKTAIQGGNGEILKRTIQLKKNAGGIKELIVGTFNALAIFDRLQASDKATATEAEKVAAAIAGRTKAAREARAAVEALIRAEEEAIQLAAIQRGELANLLLPVQTFKQRASEVSKLLKELPEDVALSILKTAENLGIGIKEQIDFVEAAIEGFKATRPLADVGLLPDPETLEQQADRIAKIFAKIPRAAGESIIKASSMLQGGLAAQLAASEQMATDFVAREETIKKAFKTIPMEAQQSIIAAAEATGGSMQQMNMAIEEGAQTFVNNRKAAEEIFKKLDADAIVRINQKVMAENLGAVEGVARRKELAEQELADEIGRAQAKQAIVSGLNQLATNLINSGSKKAFKVGKALRLADATMAAFGAITSALAAPFPLNLILTPIVAANAFFQVKKIAAMKFGGGARGGGGGTSLPSVGSVSRDVALPDVPDGEGQQGSMQTINITVAGFIGDEALLASELGRVIGEGKRDGIEFNITT